jgi:general secretion pathway protein G
MIWRCRFQDRRQAGQSEPSCASWLRGFTLLELMVVLLILALLGSIAAPRVTKYLSKAKVDAARIQVDALSAAVDAFTIDVGRIPTTEEGLKVLVEGPAGVEGWQGPYIQKQASLTDPWGHLYRFRAPGQRREFEVYTLGADDKEGGEGDARDFGNW